MEIRPYKNKLSFKNKFLRVLWGIVYNIFFRTLPGPLFYGWRNMLLRLFGAKIGRNCKIRSSIRVWAPWNIEMGDYVAIGQKAELYSVDKIIIGTKVAISQRAYICTASLDITTHSKPLVTAPIKIESFSWGAADAFVGMGVTIGEGAVVGA